GGDGGRTSVDGVHAVGVEVVGEAAGAADAGDEDDVLAAQPEVGQEGLDGLEDGVVAAAGAPADLLVGGEVLAGLLLALGEGGDQFGAGAQCRRTEVGGGAHDRGASSWSAG